MIYLNPQVRSGLGEDTFWTWIKRELGEAAQWGEPVVLRRGDVLLQYSTKGPPTCQREAGSRALALCWELHPEMARMMSGHPQRPAWNRTIESIRQCAASCDEITVASSLMVDDYSGLGPVKVLPLGVDDELFCPQQQRGNAVFWCGTSHAMKGGAKVIQWANDHPGEELIVVHKTAGEQLTGLPGHVQQHIHIGQRAMANLMGRCDRFLVSGLLRPYFLVEWEAMAAGLRPVMLANLEKDFSPGSNPRADVQDLQWSRRKAIGLWRTWLAEAAA